MAEKFEKLLKAQKSSDTLPDVDGVTLERVSAGTQADPPTLVREPKPALRDGAADPSSKPAPVDVAPAPLDERGFGERYHSRSVLGEGGMGEVRLCRDRRIGRDVAMKIIRPGSGSRSDLRLRFEREARVQGQLEHPAIVPVYDLGIGEDGAAFFTMKRLRGKTFEEIIATVREGQEGASEAEQHTPRRLLTAFVQLSLAVAFAHSRGVLHRDLKPANLMLGDFGEVYVLDWGLAKLLGDNTIETEGSVPESLRGANGVNGVNGVNGASETRARLETDETQELSAKNLAHVAPPTASGTIMGTPGYMAPEQVRGDLHLLDPRTDIYALGAILFELLTTTPLHGRDVSQEMVLVNTLAGVEARPSLRTPERAVPPELEEILVRATALDPEDRFPSVRAMVDELERYLDGDRDTARRRELAAEHAARAEEAAVRATTLASEGKQLVGAGVQRARAEAIGEVNRALALDPTHAGAVTTMLRLLVEVPREVPPEVEEEFEATLRQRRLETERVGSLGYLTWIVCAPFLLWMGIRHVPALIVLGVAIATAFGVARLIGRGTLDDRKGGALVFVASTIAAGVSSLIFGPLVMIPGLIASNTLFFAMHEPRLRTVKLFLLGGTAAIGLPLILELCGVLPPSMSFHDGVITLLPRMADFPKVPAFAFLTIASLAIVIVPSLLVARTRREAQQSDRRVFLHLWHLRQFIPDQARGASQLAAVSGPAFDPLCPTNHPLVERFWKHAKS